jgi:hypothetical protein
MTYDQRRLSLACAFLAFAAGAAFIFFKKDWVSTLALGEKQAAFWDVAFKGTAGIVAIVGAIITISKYFDENAKANRAALIEAQKPLSEKRQKVYYKLLSATATIGNTAPGDPKRIEAEAEFWLLFWGVVPMVADDEVGAAVNAFSVALDDPADGVALRNASMNLARACRKSLAFIEHRI